MTNPVRTDPGPAGPAPGSDEVPGSTSRDRPVDRRTVRWVTALAVAAVLLQRFAVPGTEVALLLPVLLGWSALALLHGVARVHGARALLFLAAVAATGAAVVAQDRLLADPLISLPAWALVVASSAPMALTLVERGLTTLLATLRALVRVGLGLAAACLVMTGLQLAVGYRDWLGLLVPGPLLLPGFAISYPYSYGSALYRANAFVGLEPSFVSFLLGLTLIAAVLRRERGRVVAVLLAAMASTFSGSGFVLAAVGLAVLIGRPRRTVLVRYVAPAAVALVLGALTPFGQGLLARVVEVGVSGSSASLRAVQPYLTLAPDFTSGPLVPFLGRGPGSSQAIVTATGVDGLLVPTPLKIFFDYGLLAGGVLAVFLVACYRRSASRALSVGLFVSLWTLQPGLTTTVLVVTVVVFVSLWAPHEGLQLEDVRPLRSAGP